jgi:hypothetical protein
LVRVPEVGRFVDPPSLIAFARAFGKRFLD